jgi:dienelactone hydrolase
MPPTRRLFVQQAAGLACGIPGWLAAADASGTEPVASALAPFSEPLADPSPPLLTGSDNAAITTAAAWEAERIRLRDRWLEFLGPPLTPPSDPQTEWIDDVRGDGYRRRSLRWRVEADTWIDAHLLIPGRPAPAGGHPAVIALHQTSKQSIDEIAGVDRPGAPVNRDQARGVDLVRAGFVVFCPRNFLWQEVASYDEAARRFHARQPRTRGMAKMLFDARQSVDQLLRIAPDVDARRIGAFGHSLGAKEVVYLMAFDDRIRAGVASDGGVGFAQTNWDAAWYLGKDCIPAAEAAGLAPHQLLALASPRRLFIVAGGRDRKAADGEETKPFVHAARQVDRLLVGETRLGFWNHGRGHVMTNVIFSRCRDWLTTFV